MRKGVSVKLYFKFFFNKEFGTGGPFGVFFQDKEKLRPWGFCKIFRSDNTKPVTGSEVGYRGTIESLSRYRIKKYLTIQTN